MILWVILGFVLGFGVIAASVQGALFDREDWKIAWISCIIGGLFVAIFELVVGIYA